jgi:hypothetical protein
MKKAVLMVAALLAGAGLCLTVGCAVQPVGPQAQARTEVEATSDPPAMIMEAAPASPGLSYVWVPGAWVWDGSWVWVHGRWQIPPRPGAVWVPHRYENRAGRHLFIRGGWQ